MARAAEFLTHERDVFRTGGEIAFDPAGALGDGLEVAGWLFVVEDSGVVVIGREAVESGIEGELVVFGEAVEGPAAPGFDEVAVDVETGAGEDDVAAALDATGVAHDVNHGESKARDSGDDVSVGVFGMAVASGELVALAVGGKNLFEIVGSGAVVGVENEIGVVEGAFGAVNYCIVGCDFGAGAVGGFGEDLFDGFVEGVALALSFGVRTDDDGRAILTADFNGGVAVGFDNDVDVAHGVRGAMNGAGLIDVISRLEDGLLGEGFQEAFDDGAFVAGGDKDGDSMRVVARSEVKFLAAEDRAGGKKPGGAEENEDKSDDDCHF